MNKNSYLGYARLLKGLLKVDWRMINFQILDVFFFFFFF